MVICYIAEGTYSHCCLRRFLFPLLGTTAQFSKVASALISNMLKQPVLSTVVSNSFGPHHHGFQVDHGLDQGQCRKFWEKMKDEEVDRNLKAQMVEEMELAFLKNICHRRILHPLSIYKYPCLPALLSFLFLLY